MGGEFAVDAHDAHCNNLGMPPTFVPDLLRMVPKLNWPQNRIKSTMLSMLVSSFLILVLAGWINRLQQNVIRYLQEENRILCELFGEKRPSFTDSQRRRPAAKAKLIGRQGLFQIDTVVTPDTLLRWYRTLVAKKYGGSAVHGPARPKTAVEIE